VLANRLFPGPLLVFLWSTRFSCWHWCCWLLKGVMGKSLPQGSLESAGINDKCEQQASSVKTLPTLAMIIRNVSWAANHHIRMISKGSCDTEDWSNDAKIQLWLKEWITLYTKIENWFKLQYFFFLNKTFFYTTDNNIHLSKALW